MPVSLVKTDKGANAGDDAGGAVVLDTPEGIRYAQLLSLRGRLRIEINTGLSHSRGSTLAIVQRMGITAKRTKKGALADVQAELDRMLAARQAGQ